MTFAQQQAKAGSLYRQQNACCDAVSPALLQRDRRRTQKNVSMYSGTCLA